MEKSKANFNFQSGRYTFGRKFFGFKSKIGLAMNGTGNLISGREMRIYLG